LVMAVSRHCECGLSRRQQSHQSEQTGRGLPCCWESILHFIFFKKGKRFLFFFTYWVVCKQTEAVRYTPESVVGAHDQAIRSASREAKEVVTRKRVHSNVDCEACFFY